VALLVAAAPAARATDLPDDARRGVDRGETVVQTRAVDGFPWPEVVVWRQVAATPVKVMAVYADFEGQARYMPEMVASRVVGRDGPGALRLFYEYEVLGPNERYTVAMSLRRDDEAFEARWSLLGARYARRLAGELRVMPHEDGALLRYTTRVDPGPLGATLGDPGSVARSMRATIEALGARVQWIAAEQPHRLDELVRALSALLAR
jgi:hypothetical protein